MSFLEIKWARIKSHVGFSKTKSKSIKSNNKMCVYVPGDSQDWNYKIVIFYLIDICVVSCAQFV